MRSWALSSLQTGYDDPSEPPSAESRLRRRGRKSAPGRCFDGNVFCIGSARSSECLWWGDDPCEMRQGHLTGSGQSELIAWNRDWQSRGC